MTQRQAYAVVLIAVFVGTLALALSVGVGTAAAQEPGMEEFNETYGGSDKEFARSVIQTSDGGYALAGFTESFGPGTGAAWLIKTDENGNEQLNRTYGGSGFDSLSSVIQTSDGGYALAGQTESFGSGSSDVWLVKTDRFGNEEFNVTFGGAGRDSLLSMVQTSGGGYALAGETESFGSGDDDAWLIKTDENGDEEFNETYGGPNGETALSVIQTSDGGYALGGDTGSFGPGTLAAWLVKTDSNGNEQFNETFGGSEIDQAFSVVQTSDGAYALGGDTGSFGSGDDDAWLVKTDENGNEEFNETYGGPNGEMFTSSLQTPEGGYALAGGTDSFGSGLGDGWLVKTDENGNEEFNETYGGSNSDSLSSLARTSDGGFALAGNTASFGSGSFDGWLIKVSVPQPPNFEVTVDTTNSPVVEGETLNATWTIENTGDLSDTQTITATVSGFGSFTRTVMLDGGESTTEMISLPTSPGDAGTYTLTVESENDTATETVVVESPANFEVELDSTNSPVVEGETLNATATIENTGDRSGTQQVSLVVGGTERDNSTVPLGAGSATTEMLEWVTDDGDAGTYTLSVESENDTAAQTVTVEDAALFDEPLPGFNDPPTNTEELDPTLYEDINGDGDGTNPTQAVNLWTQLVLNPQDFDDLTQEQIDALDWNGDGQLTPADAVQLWTQQVLS